MTLLFAQDDIENILATQPETIQKCFRQYDLFPELLAYVLSRIPNIYAVSDDGKPPHHLSPIGYESAERQLQRETMIYRGIYAVFEKRKQAERVSAETIHNQISQSHFTFQIHNNNSPRS